MLWTLKKASYRIHQKITKLVISNLKFPEPVLLTGVGSLNDLPEKVKSEEVNKVLVVTDKGLMSLGLLDNLFKSLDENKMKYIVYDRVQPNPTIDNIEDVCKMYRSNNCEGIIAFGGGSPMDCAKVAASRVTNSNKSIMDMKGLFKVKKPIPPFFAVPTTAGTGSETTIAAVVTDPSTHEKFAVVDTKLVPKIAVLDPELTVGLPPHITSATGMDALTHAVEAYIGISGTKFTNEMAEKAVNLVFENLEIVYNDGRNTEARNQMLLASYYGGAAFTRAFVGYVHAIAHNLGGLYGVPHGLANAIVLPYVLEYYGESIEDKLARLAIAAGIGKERESKKVLSERFIKSIKEMNKNMNIPLHIKELKEEDIPLIIERVIKEGNPGYPVPKIMTKDECMALVRRLLKP